MARLGLETHQVDRDVYRRTLARFREAGVVMPTFGQLKHPWTIPAAIAERLAAVDPDAPHPLNLFRVHWFNDASRRGRAHARRDRAPAGADRLAGAHRARARRAVSDDPGPQGPRRLRLPCAPRRHRPVRPDAAPRDLALDRQLLPRRRRDLPHPRLPRRRGAAGEHEPRALRLARALGRRAVRHRAHAGLGEQRQGDLRRLRGARPRSGQHRVQPVLRIRQLSRPPPVHGRGARARLPQPRRRPAARETCGLRLRHRLRGHDRGGRPSEERVRRADRRGRGGRVPDPAR